MLVLDVGARSSAGAVRGAPVSFHVGPLMGLLWNVSQEDDWVARTSIARERK